MQLIDSYKKIVLDGGRLDRDQALQLTKAPLEPLCQAANEIRQHFCGNGFDLCTIVNAKCGKCPEDCKYCAQSAHYHTDITTYPLLDAQALVEQAAHNAAQGVGRYSIVTSGRRLQDKEVAQVCQAIRRIRQEVGIHVCISLGLLDQPQFAALKEAGASRVHCNLESSRRYFSEICTTHTYDQKIQTLHAARAAGLELCSGGILGMGETMADRIDLALTLRDLEIHSIPLNFLNPIPGTPLEHQPPLSQEEKRRSVALFRFLLPDTSIRLAGGRGCMSDKGRACFCGGANAAITGDMLTTAGITAQTDQKLLQELGYQVEVVQ